MRVARDWSDPEPEHDETWEKRFRKAMAVKDDLKLSKDERYQLARWLPTVDDSFDGSWKELTSQELHDIITMMEGFLLINHMFTNR